MIPLYGLLGGLALIGGFGVILARNPVRSALSLLVTFFAMGVLMILVGSPFLGAVFLIIYAGAIITLFLFVLMLLDLRRPLFDFDLGLRAYVGVVATVALWAAGALVLWRTPELQVPFQIRASFQPDFYAQGLFTRYLVAFEVLSLLLLVALIAVLALTRSQEASS